MYFRSSGARKIQKEKTFSEFLCVFLKSTSNFDHFQKHMTLIAYVFPKLRIPENVVT